MDAIWFGVDVSKQRLDVAVRPTGEVLTVSNDDTGIKKLLKLVAKWSPQLIVMEATGGYEYACAYRLMKAGFPVAVVNPRQVRDFARALGKLAKTDPLDAKLLAHFAEAVQPPARAIPDRKLEEIGQLVSRHRQLVEMIVAERNRRMSLSGAARRDVDVTIRFLQKRLDKVDQQMKVLIANHPKRNCWTPFPALGRCSSAASWQNCRNWGNSTEGRLRLWWESHLLTTTAGSHGVGGASGVVALTYERSYTCQSSLASASMRRSEPSTSICGRLERLRK